MSLVDRVKKLAEAQGHTIKSLETAVGLGNGTIRKWDINSPSCDKLLKIANFLNTSCDFLLKGNETKKDPGSGLTEDEVKILGYYKQLKVEAHKDYIKGELARLYMAEEANQQDTEFSDEIAT